LSPASSAAIRSAGFTLTGRSTKPNTTPVRAFQFDWETAERGARAIDPTKEAVDGGQMPEPITDGQAAGQGKACRDRAGIGAPHLSRRPRGCNPRDEHGADCAVRISIAGQAAGQPRSNRAERACDHLRVIQCSAAVFETRRCCTANHPLSIKSHAIVRNSPSRYSSEMSLSFLPRFSSATLRSRKPQAPFWSIAGRRWNQGYEI
jgi:hypothetical protein